MTRTRKWAAAGIGVAVAGAAVVAGAFWMSRGATAEADAFLNQVPQVTGLWIDPDRPERLLVASPYGLLSAAPDGRIERLSEGPALMELAPGTGTPRRLWSSGWRSKTEKLGVVRSIDGGRTWGTVSDGDGGPVAFTALAVGKDALYGAETGVQVSRDHGRTWSTLAGAPGDVYDLAVSPLDDSRVYAAARGGLFRSTDGGRTWTRAHPARRPATLVRILDDGRVVAFLYGRGLVVAEGPALDWDILSTGFADRALLELTVDPTDPEHWIAAADTGAVVTSRDGGRTWGSYEGQLQATPKDVAAGRRLFAENCAACHGVRGVGERPDDIYATDEFGVVAPPLNDTAHAWHHSDDQLVETILSGSPRNERMIAWKTKFGEAEARDLVAYVKSLWSFRSIACQGPRHMTCMQ